MIGWAYYKTITISDANVDADLLDNPIVRLCPTFCWPGCPLASARTGASFVQHGLTGHLPPRRQCVTNEDDETALAAYLDGQSSETSISPCIPGGHDPQLLLRRPLLPPLATHALTFSKDSTPSPADRHLTCRMSHLG